MKRQAQKVVPIAVVLLITLITGCAVLQDLATTESASTSQEGFDLAAGQASANAEWSPACRIALGAVNKSSAFEGIAADIRNLHAPFVDVIDTPLGTIGLVILDVSPAEDEKLRLTEDGFTSYPYAVFLVDVCSGRILTSAQVLPCMRTEQLLVTNLLTGDRYSLAMAPSLVDEVSQRRETRDLLRSRATHVSIKRPCEETLEEPYQYCYEVCEPGYFRQPHHDACIEACLDLIMEPGPVYGTCILGCVLANWVWPECWEECEWIYPCDW